MVFEDTENLLGDVVHRQITVYRDQPSCALVIVSHGASLLLVSRQSRLNDFQSVVIAGHQLRSVEVANFIEAGRLEVDVIDPPTGGTGTASSDPEQKLIIVHVQADHNWPGASRTRVVKELVVEQSIEPPGLGCSPRKSAPNLPPPPASLTNPL